MNASLARPNTNDLICAVLTASRSGAESGDHLMILDPAGGSEELQDGARILYPGRVLSGPEWSRFIKIYNALGALAAIPGSGVSMVEVLVLSSEPFTVSDPIWASSVVDFARVWPPELPQGISNGFSFKTPVICW